VKPNPLLIISLVFAASFSGRAISLAGATTHALEAAPAKPPSVGDMPPEVKEPAELKAAEAAIKAVVDRTSPPDASEKAPVQLPPELAPTVPDADEGALLAAIKERAAMLDQREASLAERARLLEVIEKRVDEKTAALAALKDELESRLSFAETAAQQDITQLARMYETMKPQRAGEIFNAMDSAFAAGFLTQMNSESAALILANMETGKAYAASIIIAGRNAEANRR
jgi:flagellar motility protein MotE (MotC chaperone)